MKTIYITIFTFFICHAAPAQKVITLEIAKQMALEKNSRIKVALKNIDAARASLTGAGALHYPNISLGTTGFYFGKPISDLIPGYGAAATLAVNQALYNGGKIKLGVQVSQTDLAIQQSRLGLTTLEILYNVEKAYWQIVNLEQKLNVLINYRSLLKALLQDLQNGLNAGNVYKNDLLRANVQLNSAELNILKSLDGLTIAKLSFFQLIGSSEHENFSVSSTIPETFLATEDTEGTDLNNHPEVEVLNKAIARQKLQIRLLEADHKPSVGINLNGVSSVGKKGINFGNPNSNLLNSYYGLLSINIPIWDGGATRQRIKAQNFVLSTQEIQLEESRQLLSIEIKKLFLQVNQSVSRVKLSNVSLAQAEENLRLTNDRFKAGTLLSKDVLEAQNIWEEANSNLIDAKVQCQINQAELKKALGTLK